MNALSKELETTPAARAPQDGVSERQLVLQELYDAYVEQIYRFIYHKVGNRQDAEDITSHVFMKAVHSLDLTQDRLSMLGWLYRVARTAISDHWRKYYALAAAGLDPLEEANVDLFVDAPLIVGGGGEGEPDSVARTAHAILEMLPERHRRVLQLRFLQGYSQREVAQEVGITELNARITQHRALAKAAQLGSSLLTEGTLKRSR